MGDVNGRKADLFAPSPPSFMTRFKMWYSDLSKKEAKVKRLTSSERAI